MLTETWVSEADGQEYSLPGYDTHYAYAVNRCDGIIVFVKSDLNSTFEKVNILATTACSVKFCCKQKMYNILSIYRSPSNCVPVFLNSLSEYYDQNINHMHWQYILIGDMNIDILDDCRQPQYKDDDLTSPYVFSKIRTGFTL